MKYSFLFLLVMLFQAVFIISCKKPVEPPVPVTPDLSFADVNIPEGTGITRNSAVIFKLSTATTNVVTLKWHTEDITAKAGEDYTAATDGTVTFNAGEVSKKVEIPITTDSYLELNEKFTVVVSDLVNAVALNTQASVTIENDDTYTAEKVDDGYITPAEYPGMALVWADEFDGTALNTSDWTHEKGGGGWGNNELQIYTDVTANSSVKDGYLTITALKNQYTGGYTSARLVSKGKKEFTYGRIDIRAKLPKGQGIWPALWMLGGNISTIGWPRCGEIDIMEFLGHDLLTAYGTIHYYDGGHTYKGYNYKVTSAENYNEKFHVFTLIWEEETIKWYVDYNKYYQVGPTDVKFEAFNLPQFFIFNVAVGGNWPGYPDATTTFPQSMIVDYVRVFQ